MMLMRSRSSNFTRDEKRLILSLVRKHPIIESKKTDAISSNLKRKAWRAVMLEFNAKTHGELRNADSLNHWFKNYRHRLKKQPDALLEHEYAVVEEQVILDPMDENVPDSFKEIARECESNLEQREEEDDVITFDKVFNEGLSGDSDYFNEANANTFEEQTKAAKPTPSHGGAKQSNKIGPSEAILELAKEKMKLIGIKNDAVKKQNRHQEQMNNFDLELMKEKLDFEKRSNRLELAFQKQKKQIELQFLKDKCKLELGLIRSKLN